MTHSETITHVSPVWFYLTKQSAVEYLFDGVQDVNHLFVKSIKSKNPRIKVVPRFYIRPDMDELKWFLNSRIYSLMTRKLVDLCQEYEFDGIIFDIPIFNNLKYSGNVKHFIELVVSEFERKSLLKYLVLSGSRFSLNKDEDSLRPFLESFDKVLISTYDYRRGWLSPKQWFLQNAQFWTRLLAKYSLPKHRIMLGIQFYGYLEKLDVMSRRQIQIEE